ncbi:MAG: M1 family metallopeptidase [FCB group bacterium]|nr:M1 family metallopeptidase [FCB group bacterium]
MLPKNRRLYLPFANGWRYPLLILAIPLLLSADNGLDIHYKLELVFKPRTKESPAWIEGVNHVTITNRWDRPLGEVYFHNNANGFYNPRDDKTPRTIIGKVQSTRLGKVMDTEKVTMKIGLFPALKPGESVLIDIPFVTKIAQTPGPFFPTVGSRGDTTIYNLIYFYPVLEFFHADGWHVQNHGGKENPHSNLAEYEVALTSPREYVVGTSAHLLNTDTLRNGSLKRKYSYPRAVSFSAVLSKRFRKRDLNISGIDISLLYTPGQAHNVKNLISDLEDLLPYYTEQFGPCPNDKLTITMGYSLNSRALSTANYIVLQENMDSFRALAHELAHQWFGNAINADESYETWLNESFAEYGVWLYKQSKLNEKNGRSLKPELNLFDFWSDLRSMTTDDWIRLVHNVIGDQALPPVYQPGKQTDWESQAYAYSRYIVGNHALQMLQSSIGDSLMQAIIRTYTRENTWKTVNTETFISVVQRLAGKMIADNFRLALTTNIRPDIKITAVDVKKNSRRQWLTTVKTAYEGDWLLPVDIRVITAAGDTIFRKQIRLTQQKTLHFTTSTPVVSVELDPDKKMFDSNRYNNRWPRRFTFQPIYGLPSWEVYKLYYRPRVIKDWQNNWRYGIRLSGGLGLNLMPFLPAFFQNTFDLDITFSTGLVNHNWGGRFIYRTPLKSVDLTYWEFRASYEYPRNRQILSLITYLGKPSYYVANGRSAYKRLTTQLVRTEYSEADSNSWWNKGQTLTINESFIRFFYSPDKRSVVHLSLIAGQSLKRAKRDIFYRIASSLDYERHDLDRIILRLHGESGFVWDDRPSNTLRYQLRYVPRIWKEREDFIPLFRGFANVGENWWNSVVSLGMSAGWETNFMVWPMIYIDGAMVETTAKSIVDRVVALSRFDPLYLAVGLGLESQTLIEVGLYFPFWVSHPPNGEENFAFRAIMQWGFYF